MLLQSWLSIPERNVHGVLGVQKFGRIADIDAGVSGVTVWTDGTLYGYPSAAEPMFVASTAAADADEGTGAWDVTVQYLGADLVERAETITLAGQTEQGLSVDPLRVYRMAGGLCGSGGVNAGDIWCGSGTFTSGVPANKRAHIATGMGQTHMALWTVPGQILDKNGNPHYVEYGVITGWSGTCGSTRDGVATLDLRTRVPGYSWRSRDVRGAGLGTPPKEFPFGIEVEPGTDVMVQVLSNGVNNTSIEAGFDIAVVTSAH